MRLHAICAAAALGGAMLTSGATAQTVPDYSFEMPTTFSYVYRPTATGVVFSGNAGISVGGGFGPATVPDQRQFGFIQSGFINAAGVVVPSSIAFDVTGLAIDTAYTVSFYAALRNGYAVNPVTVSFNGASLGTFSATSTTAFQLFTTGAFTALAGTGVLSFTGTANPGDTTSAIDLVTLTPQAGPPTGAVPEPAAWLTMIGGMGLIGTALRRRRAATRVRFA